MSFLFLLRIDINHHSDSFLSIRRLCSSKAYEMHPGAEQDTCSWNNCPFLLGFDIQLLMGVRAV
jgi:hypothetical protein